MWAWARRLPWAGRRLCWRSTSSLLSSSSRSWHWSWSWSYGVVLGVAVAVVVVVVVVLGVASETTAWGSLRGCGGCTQSCVMVVAGVWVAGVVVAVSAAWGSLRVVDVFLGNEGFPQWRMGRSGNAGMRVGVLRREGSTTWLAANDAMVESAAGGARSAPPPLALARRRARTYVCRGRCLRPSPRPVLAPSCGLHAEASAPSLPSRRARTLCLGRRAH